MAFSITTERGIFKEFVFEFQGKEVEQAYKTIINELKANAEIDGFRKGKAPEWIIKKKYRSYILEGLAQELIDKIYEEAKALGYDVMDLRVNLDKSDFSEKESKFSIEGYIEIFPIIEAEKLKDLKDLELEIPKFEFQEEMVQDYIEEALYEKATLEPKDGPIEEGDYVILNYTVIDKQDGEKVSQNLEGVLEKLKLRKDLYEAILGKKEDDIIKLENLSLREGDKEDQTKVDIEVKIEGVKKLILPELTDELAKELGLGETKEEAIENARKYIQNYLEFEKIEAKMTALNKYLLEEYKDVAISNVDSNRITKAIFEDEIALLNETMDLESLNEDAQKVIYQITYQKALEKGMQSAKTRSILVSYAKLFGLEATEEDIEKYIDSQVKAYSRNLQNDINPEELKNSIKEYFSREDKRSVLIKDILAEKAMDKLLEMVKFKEVENEATSQKEENVEQV